MLDWLQVNEGHVLDLIFRWLTVTELRKLSAKSVSRCQYKEESSGRAVSLGAFFGCWWLWVRTFARLGFSFEHFAMLMATEVHWFGFGCLGCLCGLWVSGRRRRESLASRTGSEHVYVLDFATLQFRRVGTGGTYLQVNFLNPSKQREKN